MKMRFLWILSLSFFYSHQNTESNCVRRNPGVLDVTFDFFPELYNTSTATDNIKNALSLISTRFKRVYNFQEDNNNNIIPMRTTLDWISLYANISKEHISFMFYPPYHMIEALGGKFRDPVSMYEEIYAAINEINVAHKRPPIVGLYLPSNYMDLSKSSAADLEAVKKVFGEIESSSLALGIFGNNCHFDKDNIPHLDIFMRLNFITCTVFPMDQSAESEWTTPEVYADVVVRTCDRLRNKAKAINIHMEVMCLTGYPSKGQFKGRFEGSVEGMGRFWCRIARELSLDKSHAQLIMWSAFESLFPSDKSGDEALHMGWWKRSGFYGGGQFIEKVEELPGGTEFRKCTGICKLCTHSDDCCEKNSCDTDASFRLAPFSESVRFCRTRDDNCSLSFVPITKPGNPTISQSEFGRPIPEILTIIIFSLGGIIVTSIVAFLIHRRVASKIILNRQEINNFFEGSPSSAGGLLVGQLDTQEVIENLPYDKQLEIARETFEIYQDQLLGRGEFGVVVKGLLGNDIVAVKTTLSGVDKVYLKALLLELKVLSYLGQHENIVNLRGAHTPRLNSGKLYLFLELCPLGSLLAFLRSRRNEFMDENEIIEKVTQQRDERQVTVKDLLQWSLQVASAMQHLAEKKGQELIQHIVIHGDIAARNVLVFSLDQVKLTDFGLSRRLYDNLIYTKKNKGPLPWRHMSVEALRDFHFSVQSDVWAFGTTMWETFSLGEVPFSGRSYSEEFVRLLIDGLCLPRPQKAHPFVYELMTSCWTIDVQLRPSINTIHFKLTSTLNQLYTNQHYFHPSEMQ